ncbi:D-aspartate oxidase-like isoform X2 [Mytilus trossulus]
MTNIAVLGAGAVGLSTAINIKRALPHVCVTIIADKFGTETTSHGAGGIFKPTAKLLPGVPESIARKWTVDSWKWFSGLTLSSQAGISGNQMVAGYYFCNEEVKNPLYADYVYTFSRMTDDELRSLNMLNKYKYGYHITTVITYVKKYLPWLTKLYLDGGGKLEGRRVENLNELRADWIKYWMYTDDGKYILPNGDLTIIGGVRQANNYSLELDEEDKKEIQQKCYKFWPPLQGAQIDSEWVGLRPSRTPLRLEPEIMNLSTGKLKVVHNYGHGGVGIALSWGTSLHATELVKDMLQSHSRL